MNPNWYRFSDVPTAWYQLNWPAELDTEQVAACMHALAGSHISVMMRFVVHVTPEGIKHYVNIPEVNEYAVLRTFQTFLPSDELTTPEPFKMEASAAMRVHFSTKNRALNTANPEAVSHAILSSLSDIGQGESILFEWVLGMNLQPVSVPSFAAEYEANSKWGMFFESLIHKPHELDAFAHASMQTKNGSHLWRALLLVGVNTVSAPRSEYLVNQILGAIRGVEAPGVGLSMKQTYTPCLADNYDPFFWPLRVNANELTTLLAWPLGDKEVPGIARVAAKHLAVSAKAPRSRRIIARSNIANSENYLTLSPKDGLMHTHVLGPTGVGKSTLLLNLITQDIAAGRGVMVIDPKGDLITETLQRIPQERYEDVVLLDPSDEACPVGLNPLAAHGRPTALVADDILSIFKGLYGSYFGPRTQDVMHAGLLTLCSVPGMSLCALPSLYTNPAFRSRLVAKLNDPLGLGSFWSWYEGISEKERIQVLAPLMNKLRAFLLRPAMRRTIGQARPRFDLSEAMTSRKIVLVNLAKGLLGKDTAQLFGSLVIAQLWQAIQGRVAVPVEYRAPMFVYVDEFQDYLRLPTDVGDILAQSRGYGVGMVLAHQHLGQLPKELKSGILSNARSRICFQLGHEDALVMSKSSNLLSAQDFEKQARYQIYAQLVGNGEVLPWASGETLQPIEPISEVEAIRAMSRERYGINGAEVEASIAAQIDVSLATREQAIGRKQKVQNGQKRQVEVAHE
jgi:hypothetical protein